MKVTPASFASMSSFTSSLASCRYCNRSSFLLCAFAPSTDCSSIRISLQFNSHFKNTVIFSISWVSNSKLSLMSLYPYLTIVKEKRVKNLQSYDLLKLKNFDYKLITAIILMIWYFHQKRKIQRMWTKLTAQCTGIEGHLADQSLKHGNDQ